MLPRQFIDFFANQGLNIEHYTEMLEREFHKRIHGKGGGEAWRNSWNKQWEAWIDKNPHAEAIDILNQMHRIRAGFGF